MNTATMDPSELLATELAARGAAGDRICAAAGRTLDSAFFDYVYALPVAHLSPGACAEALTALNRAHARGIRALIRNERISHGR
jgi:hypothetical protein